MNPADQYIERIELNEDQKKVIDDEVKDYLKKHADDPNLITLLQALTTSYEQFSREQQIHAINILRTKIGGNHPDWWHPVQDQ